ncbi:MAG: hypothetical protein NTW19_14290 [Planctomycetota bacterium]|nr:hypothetical protein [Planctomycetota bacterium]
MTQRDHDVRRVKSRNPSPLSPFARTLRNWLPRALAGRSPAGAVPPRLEPLEPRTMLSTAVQLLQAEPEQPRFADSATMIPLSRWGWQLTYDAAIELSDKWGYAIELGDATQSYVDGLDNPNSDISKRVAYAAADPTHRSLAVLVHRPLFDASFIATLPPETWLRDSNGQFILDTNGNKVWSPEAPNSVYEQAGAIAAAPLAKIVAKANGAPLVLLNGGEYSLNVFGWNGNYLPLDPAVMAAKGATDWYTYLSQSKARQENLISDAVRAAVPEPARDLYIHYFDDGRLDRGVYSTYWQWVFDYQSMHGNSDLPNSSLYYKEFNTGWSGTRDLLSQALNSTAQHLALGDTLAYNWVNGGYGPQYGFSDDAHYMGFLKSLYLAGMVGGVAGYFSFPAGGFGADLGATPPSWLQQMMSLGQAQALFSHVDGFLSDGTLLPGPDMQRFSTDLPAYEFPTGDADARVIVRQSADGDQWLISAWAAAGADRPATVTIPILGEVTLQARAVGSVYLASLDQGQPALSLLDTDGMHPTADLNIVHVSAGAHGQVDLPGDRVVRTGEDLALQITPDAGYRILELLVDGQAVTLADHYTFDDVSADHTFAVTFAPLAPRVTEVLVKGTAWSSGFLAFLAAEGLGDGDGYAIPAGSGAQLAPLPWNNVDQVTLRFSSVVEVSQSDLTVRGVNVPAYAISAFSTGTAADGSFEATWTLDGAVGVDKLLLHLADTVADTGGAALDGEWVNPTSRATPLGGSSAFASGDGAAGGAFDFRIDFAPGDANQNGGVNVQDVVLTRDQQGKSLPVGEPALPAGAMAALVVAGALPTSSEALVVSGALAQGESGKARIDSVVSGDAQRRWAPAPAALVAAANASLPQTASRWTLRPADIDGAGSAADDDSALLRSLKRPRRLVSVAVA